jgi:predicted ATPase
MNLTLENVGAIKHAKVAFNGLTVIAGENDTGKSTVGKLMFAVVKAFSRYQQDLNVDKKKNILAAIEKIYFKIRRLYDFRRFPELKKEFHPPGFFGEIEKLLPPNNYDDIKLLLEKKRQVLKNAQPEHNGRPHTDLDSPIESLDALCQLITQPEDKKALIKWALTKALVSEFHFELTPKHSSIGSLMSFFEENNHIFEFKIEDNQVTAFERFDEIFFNDVTFVETPLFLQMYDVIHSASTLLEILNEDDKGERLERLSKPKISLHIKDLMSKLAHSQYFSLTFFEGESFFLEFLKNISQLVHGKFYFDKKLNDFLFHKATSQDETIRLKLVNTASGIKSFGILQLLVESNFLDERSLLIIDEPETHLHPQWQVEYAKLIVMLVKNNIPVLLSSHSPYMIQALKVWSEKMKIEERVNYYLAEKSEHDDSAEIVEVTEDLNRIFKKLSDPLQELVWS